MNANYLLLHKSDKTLIHLTLGTYCWETFRVVRVSPPHQTKPSLIIFVFKRLRKLKVLAFMKMECYCNLFEIK